MTDSFDDRRKAKEEEFFIKQNKAALEKIRAERADSQTVRKSPITGEPMQQKEISGVIVDICPTTGGIWLDAGELDQLISQNKNDESILGRFLDVIKGKQ